MKYVVRLVTARVLERPLQKFAATKSDAEAVAAQILKALCHPGDSVDVFELAEVWTSTLLLMPEGKIDRVDVATGERKCLG